MSFKKNIISENSKFLRRLPLYFLILINLLSCMTLIIYPLYKQLSFDENPGNYLLCISLLVNGIIIILKKKYFHLEKSVDIETITNDTLNCLQCIFPFTFDGHTFENCTNYGYQGRVCRFAKSHEVNVVTCSLLRSLFWL